MLIRHRSCLVMVLTIALAPLARVASAAQQQQPGVWPAEKANAWYEKQPWLVGANFAPSTAINQLEMFQADTWDPKTIDRELALAKGLGLTSMRVFLHHLLWEQDQEGFLKRVDEYLAISDKHGIGTMLVLFDSVWDPEPKLGKQREPVKGLHNSGWVQSPGKADLLNKERHKLIEEYVKGVVGRFKDDKRVQVWDIWNEPDNMNGNSYGKEGLNTEPDAAEKHAAVLELLKNSFAWARQAGPSQPLTSGIWVKDRIVGPKPMLEIEKLQLAESDVISFHSYADLDGTKAWVERLRKEPGRPILCTEYMARPEGSTFDPILGYFKEQKIAAYNWGFVAGKTNTIFAWETWKMRKRGEDLPVEPKEWFHDIFHADGKPYRDAEVKYIREVTGAGGR